MYAGILLVRAGFWHEHMPSAVARFADLNAWVVAIIPLVVAIQAFGVDDPVGGVIDLIIAALAFVVVRSERPLSPTSGAAPTPRRMPGPPTSAR